MNKRLIITLLNIPNIGRKSVRYLLSAITFESLDANEILGKLKEANCINKKIIVPEISDIISAKVEADRIIMNCEELDINITTVFDDNFPYRCKSIKDYPVLLYYKGDISSLNSERVVSIVGSRDVSEHTLSVAEKLGGIFTDKGFVIASGLAKGCDTSVHYGCIKSAGITVAVMPCGLDCTYPKENKKLSELILVRDGCLVSEYPPGAEINRGNFIDRDRLLAAFSDALIVVSTKEAGGTMHTVKFAEGYSRKIACYRPDNRLFESVEYSGNRKLFNEKDVTGISNAKDIECFIDYIKNGLKVYLDYDCKGEQLKLF